HFSAPGGVPLPWRRYSCRPAAYSSSRFTASPSKSFLRNGTHQPQPVPAPLHSDSWLATRGRSTRMKLRSLRLVTWKQEQTLASSSIVPSASSVADRRERMNRRRPMTTPLPSTDVPLDPTLAPPTPAAPAAPPKALLPQPPAGPGFDEETRALLHRRLLRCH